MIPLRPFAPSMLWTRDYARAARELSTRHGIARRPAADRLEGAPTASLGVRIERAAEYVGLGSQAVECDHHDLPAMLRSCAPAMVLVPGPDGGALAVTGATSKHLVVVDMHGRDAKVALSQICARLCRSALDPQLRTVLDAVGMNPDDQRRVGRCVSQAEQDWRVRHHAVLLRGRIDDSLGRRAAEAGIFKRLGATAAAFAGLQLGIAAAWGLLGRGALGGLMDGGWIAGWALLLVSTIPLLLLSNWASARLAVNLSLLVKRRSFLGALRMAPDVLNRSGTGGHMSRVLESESLENLATQGGLGSGLAVLQLALAGFVMSASALQGWGIAFIGAASLLVGYGFVLYWRRTARWVQSRLSLTDDLFERMAGHATRITQQPAALWHTSQEAALVGYLERSVDLDRVRAWMGAVPMAWLTAGVAAVGALIALGAPITDAAIALGGVVLARRGLQGCVDGVGQLVDAAVTASRIQPLLAAAGQRDDAPVGTVVSDCPTVATLANLEFAYPGSTRRLLSNCSLEISKGDKLVLRGDSGTGKSTLASILAGARRPTGGLVLVAGMDRDSVGYQAWRRRVVLVPQFHDNHIVSASLLFNLLMGSHWPPRRGDHDRAEAVCQSLGLRGLLERMPGGLAEHVGDHGWKLSHGEQSRIFLARALLQTDAQLLVVDEGFGALDPDAAAEVMDVLMQIPQAVLVIGHP